MTGDLDITNNRLRIVHPGKGKATIGGNAPRPRVRGLRRGDVREARHPGTACRAGSAARRRHRRLREGDAPRVDRDGEPRGRLRRRHPPRGAARALVMRNSAVTKNQAQFDGGGISASCQGGIGRGLDPQLDRLGQPRRLERRRHRPRRRDLPPDDQRHPVRDPAQHVREQPLRQRGRRRSTPTSAGCGSRPAR